MDDEAVVRVIDGNLLLDDPVALGVLTAVDKRGCFETAQRDFGRIEHFRQRILELGIAPIYVVIVIANADDPHGGPLVEKIMPGVSFDEIRAQRQTPYARGMVERALIQEFLELIDHQAAAKLKALNGIAVVVVDYGVADVFTIENNEARKKWFIWFRYPNDHGWMKLPDEYSTKDDAGDAQLLLQINGACAKVLEEGEKP